MYMTFMVKGGPVICSTCRWLTFCLWQHFKYDIALFVEELCGLVQIPVAHGHNYCMHVPLMISYTRLVQ